LGAITGITDALGHRIERSPELRIVIAQEKLGPLAKWCQLTELLRQPVLCENRIGRLGCDLDALRVAGRAVFGRRRRDSARYDAWT